MPVQRWVPFGVAHTTHLQATDTRIGEGAPPLGGRFNRHAVYAHYSAKVTGQTTIAMDPIPPPRGVGPSAPRQGPADRRVVEQVRRFRPGDAVVRVTRPKFTGFARRGAGRLEASLTLEEPRGAWGRVWRTLVGAPIHSELEINERLPKKKALAVFSSDALSSVAYAPQATLVILLAAGTAALSWSLPISIAVVLLLAVVV